MKVETPEISWHGRDPVYSADFQPGKRSLCRIATASTDTNVLVNIETPFKNRWMEDRCRKLEIVCCLQCLALSRARLFLCFQQWPGFVSSHNFNCIKHFTDITV